MTQLEKLLRRIATNPKAVTFEELDLVLTRHGWERSQPGSGSSHYTYRKGGRKLTVPRTKPHLKPTYVRQALSFILYEDDRDK